MNLGGALATYGAATGHLNSMDDADTQRAMAAMEKERLANQVRIMQLREDVIRAASRRHHSVKPAAAAPAAAPMPPIAGAGGVSNAPVENPGIGDSPEIGGSYGMPKFANGGEVGDARSNKFDGIFDASKWDHTFAGLPTLHKTMLHAELGHHPDDEHFVAKVMNGAREQHLANGGMAGAPPFPGFANGGSTAPAEGIKQGSMQHRADLQSQIPGAPAPAAPQTQGGGVNFFNGNSAPRPQLSDEERRRRMMEAERNRPPAKRADGGMMGGALDADGGLTHGPGTTTSDSIPARLSKGEFVVPADVVAALGTQHFQKLIDKYHTEV